MANIESRLEEANERYHLLSSAFQKLGFSVVHTDSLKDDQSTGLPHPHQFLKKDYQGAPSLYLQLGIPFNADVKKFMGIEAEERGDDPVYEMTGPFNHGLLPFLELLSNDPLLTGVIQKMGFRLGSSQPSQLYVGSGKEKRIVEGFNLYPPKEFRIDRCHNVYDCLNTDPQLSIKVMTKLDQMLGKYQTIAETVDKFKHPTI